jgi:hypothetical protein
MVPPPGLLPAFVVIFPVLDESEVVRIGPLS